MIFVLSLFDVRLPHANRRFGEASQVPVMVAHGTQTKTTGARGCFIGRSLYEGTVDLREALQVAAE